jgi:hypothetical protein
LAYEFRLFVPVILMLAAVAVSAAPVELPVDPPASREVALEEIWRIGADDEDVLMGVIFDGKVDADGNTYLIDRQLSQVIVLDRDGEFVTTLGREGEGPGELRNPHGLFLMDQGRVGVIQGFPGRVTILNADDTPGGTIEIGGSAEEGGFNFVRALVKCGDHLVGAHGRAAFDMEKGKSVSTNTLSVMDMEGAQQVEICSHEQENDFQRRVFDEAAQFSELDTWSAWPGGLIYTAPVRDEYLIRVRDLDGSVVREMRRDFELRARDEEDKQELTDGMVIVMNGRRMEIESKALDTDPAIEAFEVAADGRLFVRTCWDARKLLADGVASRYDVISPEGEFIEQVSYIVPEFDNRDDRLVFMDGEHFLLIRNFDQAQDAMGAGFGGDEDEDAEEDLEEAEPIEVVLYRLPA